MEGPDGSGKTTQSKLLVQALKDAGHKVVHTREPGGTSFAENLRRILLNPRYKILPLTELILYEASRAQHTEEVVRPALKKGLVVLCERYTDATYAYQGFGRKISLSLINKLNHIATCGLRPDLTVVLDIPVNRGLNRARAVSDKSRGKTTGGDRLEQENSAFHQRVRKGYFAIARSEPRRVKIVPGVGTIQQVHSKVRSLVLDRLS